jgi:hypothetical protein
MIRRKKEAVKILQKKETKDSSERPLNVLMMGIDSMSRLNLMRTMPKTYMYVKESPWFYEMQGHHKVSH